METQIKKPVYLERVTCCNFGDTREIFDEMQKHLQNNDVENIHSILSELEENEFYSSNSLLTENDVINGRKVIYRNNDNVITFSTSGGLSFFRLFEYVDHSTE